MLKVQNISFKGISAEMPQKPNPQKVVSNSVGNETNLSPAVNTVAIQPTVSTKELNESDVIRYKKVQAEWAKMYATETGIPYENIINRLPDIRMAKLEKATFAHFLPDENIIEINSNRQQANLCGGDESHIVHESIHGLFHNLRRAYVKDFSKDDLATLFSNIVLEKMLKGENKPIFKGREEQKGINEKTTYKNKTMLPPQLSLQERKILVDAISKKGECLAAMDMWKLSDEGVNSTKDTLMPYLIDYKKTIGVPPAKTEEECLKRITDYINAFAARKSLLYGELTSNQLKDLEKNLQTPLTEKEKDLAKNSLSGNLETKEGILAMDNDSYNLYDISFESYFVSYEEKLARKYASKYRLEKINQKIDSINSQGITPGQNVLTEKKTVENNLKVLELIDQFEALEQEIVSAPKNPAKLLELNSLIYEIKSFYNNPETEELKDLVKALSKNNKGRIVIRPIYFIINNLPQEKADLLDDLVENIHKYNRLSSPERLLANTPENNNLKQNYYKKLEEIRELSMGCDLTALSKTFFKTRDNYFEYCEKH